jgi:hypothetical protein
LTITEIRQIPDDLPPARLYLDDIEQIVALFAEAADSETTKAVFSVDNFYCTTIEDLQQLNRSRSSRFRIGVTAGRILVGVLRVAPHQTFWFYGPAMKEENIFKVYGQLQALFEVRKIRWKAWFLSTPVWLVVPAMLVALVVDAIGYATEKASHPNRFLVIAALSLPIAIWMTYKTWVQHSVVEFHRVHEPHGIRRRLAEWKPYIIAVTAAIIGAFSKELFELIARALKR